MIKEISGLESLQDLKEVGIKHFYDNDLIENTNVVLKKHPSDFIVQEITGDKLCGFDFIIDVLGLFKSLDFLYSLIDKDEDFIINENGLNLKNYELSDLYFNEDKNNNYLDFLNQSGLSFEDFNIYDKNLLNFINFKLVFEIKRKWDLIKQKNLKINCGENNKALRTEIYKLLKKIPFINSKTVDGKIIINFSSEGIFRTVACKVMLNSMDIANKVCRSLNLKNGKVGIAGNKDKKAVTFQEISIDANFECIFEMAYENYDDRIIEVLSKNYEDPLNKFFMCKTKGNDNLEDLSYELKEKISMKNYNLINFSNYLIIKILKGDKIEREGFLEIRDKIESCCIENDGINGVETNKALEGDNLENDDKEKPSEPIKSELAISKLPQNLSYQTLRPDSKSHELNTSISKSIQSSSYNQVSGPHEAISTIAKSFNPFPYLKSSIQFFDIYRSDIKRLGDLKGNRFTIKLENTSKINTNSEFLNYFGVQRFGKCKNNHFIGEKILNKKYEEAVEMIMKNSKGYESYINLNNLNNNQNVINNNFKDLTSFCDTTEKYIFMMKMKNKSDKNIIFGLKREIRMIYLHAYQSYFFNESINEEINKNENKNLLPEVLPLKKFNDKMLKGGERKVISKCFDLKGKKSGNDFIISFNLCTSSYATMALRELLAKKSSLK